MPKFDEGYSPVWSPGDPVDPEDTISEEEMIRLYRASKAGADEWTAEDETNFWDAVPGGKPEDA